MNWVIGIALDIIMLVVVFIMYKKGSKDGFAKTMISFLGVFIALVLATVLSGPVANFAYDSFVKQPVQTTIEKTLDEQIDNVAQSVPSANKLIEGIEKTLEKSPSFIKKAFAAEEKKQQLANDINEIYTPDTKELAARATETIVKPIVTPLLSVITFILVFFIVSILCFVVSKSLKLVNKIPLLGGLNSLLGGIVGALRGIVAVLIINWVLVALVSDGGNLFGIINAEAIKSSLIMKNLALINPLSMVLGFVISAK